MAKNRNISTRFWSDNFVAGLKPSDRYLFLYLITNDHANISGMYELPLKHIAVETGIGVGAIAKSLERLQGKIFYVEGWIYIKNFVKYQASKSDDIQKAIVQERGRVPEGVLSAFQALSERVVAPSQEGAGMVSTPSLTSTRASARASTEGECEGDFASAAAPRSSPSKFSPIGAEIIKAFEAV